MKPLEKMLDLRGLPAPQPFELAIAAAMELASGESLVVLTPLMPVPLIQWLEAEGFPCHAEPLAGGAAALRIRAPAAAGPGQETDGEA